MKKLCNPDAGTNLSIGQNRRKNRWLGIEGDRSFVALFRLALVVILASTGTLMAQCPAVVPTAAPATVCSGQSVVLSTGPLTTPGSMLTFSGSNYAQINNFNISPGSIPVLTASVWVKRGAASANFRAIISNDNGGYDRAIMVASDGNYHIFAGRDINTGIPSVVDQWDFISVYWSSSAVTMWKNGVQVYTTTGEDTSTSGTTTRIGVNINSSFYFVGSLDQISFWNTARTTAQLKAEMTSYLVGNEAGLLAYYKMDEGTGTTAGDIALPAESATLVNNPAWQTATEPSFTYLWSPGGSTLASPTVNPTATTSYSVAVTNSQGCAKSGSATVTVNSTAIICGGNQTANTTAGTCSAVVTYASPTVTGTPTPTVTYAFSGATTASGSGSGSGLSFNKGITTVTLTATNSCGSVDCSFTVTVTDNINPTITAPANISGCTIGNLGVPVTGDNCAVASVTNNAPATFPVGMTSVVWTVTDTSGRTATATQTVSVTSAPAVSAVNATPAAICVGAQTTLSATASSGLGNMLTFNGFNRVQISALNISPSVMPVLTASTWVKRNGSVSSFGAILSNDNGGYDRAIMVGSDNRYHIFAGRDIDTGIPSVIGVWDFISVYWSPSAITMWKNGIQVFTTSGDSFSESTSGTGFGTSSSGNWPLAVTMDQVSIWSTARTSAQLTSEMSSVLGGSESGLVGYYKFDEGTGTTTADATVNARTGTLISNPAWSNATEPAVSYLWSPGGSTLPNPIVAPLTTTTYSVTVTNAQGCSATSTGVTVTVNSAAMSCIANQSVNLGSGCSATVTYPAPTITGNLSPTLSYVFSGATTGSGSGSGSGSNFNKGVTTVTLTLTSSCGNSTCSFTVSVIDNTNPTITAPANVSICQGNPVVLGTPITADNCGVSPATNNAPANFPTGTTTVIWTVADTSGNIATATQTVTIYAVPTAPSANAFPAAICLGQSTALGGGVGVGAGFEGFYAPSNWTISNGPGGSVNTSSAPASVVLVSGNSGSSGATTFSRGILSASAATTITFNWSYSTSDGAPYDYPQYFVNNVPYSMPQYSSSGASNQSGAATIIVPAGQSFGLGVYTGDGFMGSCAVTFSNFSASSGNLGTTNWYTLAVGGTSIGSSSQNSNLIVTPTATGTNSYYAETVSNGCASARTLVTVEVATAPAITCIPNQTAVTPSNSCNAVINYATPVTTGTPMPSLSYLFSGATTGSGTGTGSGSNFNIGVTGVKIIAANSCGSVECNFTVTVTDTTMPVIAAPANVTLCQGNNIVLENPVATDNCGIYSISSTAGSNFPIGTTTVTYYAMDNSGNIASATQQVTVTGGNMYYADTDNDGYGNALASIQDCGAAPAGYVSNNGDCDDANATINPLATEVAGNNIDENCDGITPNYCYPNLSFGCSYDFVFASVTLNTLSNNTGFGCVNGTTVTDYTSNPALTTTLQAGNAYELAVSLGANSQGVAAWIDMNDDGTFSNSERIISSNEIYQFYATPVFNVFIPCNAQTGQHRLRLRTNFYTPGLSITPCDEAYYGEIEDYLITIAPIASCPSVTMLNAENVTTTTAALSWENTCGGNAWTIMVQAAGLGVPTGSGLPLSTLNYNAANLMPGTNYEFYVRTDCGSGSFGSWSGPFAFQTKPVDPGFGQGVWNVAAYNGSQFETFAGYYVDPNMDFNTSNYWSMYNSPSSATGYIGGPINDDAHSYRAKRKGFTPGCYSIVVVNHDDDTALYVNGVQVFEHVGAGDFHPAVWSGTLDANSEVEIATKEFGDYSNSYYMFTSPINYYVDADGDGYGNPFLPPVDACNVTVGYVANDYDCDDSTAAVYPGAAEIYFNGIDENCNGMGDDLGLPGHPYCGVDYTVIEPITSVVFAGIDNQSNAQILYASNGGIPLENFTAITGNVAAGQSYPMALQANTGGSYTVEFTVWIDWNHDLQFGNTEEMHYAGSVTDSNGEDGITAMSTITVPEDAMLGTTRMRVHKLYGEIPLDPCGGGFYGQAEDYTINVASACEPVIWFADADSDGYGNAAMTLSACNQPVGYVAVSTDCNDAVAAINPGHAEVLYNGVDDNCDGNLDEGLQYTTQVQSQQCASTLTSINSFIVAYSKPSVTRHRFEVTNVETNQVEVIERYQNYFSPTMLLSYDYATTYSVRVEIQRNGIWLGYYGPSCMVSTPAVLVAGGAATISPSQCGNTIPTISTLIATTSLPGVTGYRFRVTNATDPSAPNQVQIIERNQFHWFALTMLSTFNYGTTYLVEVSIRTNGVYSAFGSPCAVTSPAVPMLTNCGATIATKGTLISTASLNRVTSHRFEITNTVTGQITTLDRLQNWFTFNNIPAYTPGVVYTVRVAVMTSGVYSPFGEACFITSPAAARTNDEQIVFDAVAYPNPFENGVKVSVKTFTEQDFSIKLYDMAGRLIQSSSVNLLELESATFGESFPSGVYNMIITQGDQSKSLRIIKR